MKIVIGTYHFGIYTLNINEDKHLFENLKQINSVTKASYLMNEPEFAFLYSNNDLQYLQIGSKNILLDSPATHISFDEQNQNIYVSSYHSGLLQVLNVKDNYQIKQTIKYPIGSKIHYANYINTTNEVGVVDLGLNKIYFYNANNSLNLNSDYLFNEGDGPRHFINHPSLPIIYVITELNPKVITLEKKGNKWQETATFQLEKGAGSAIRISSDTKHLFAAVRDSNLLYHYNIKNDGSLSLLNSYPTLGNHPRDFNVFDHYVVISNMNSNNLTLYEINNNQLILRDSNFKLNSGAAIIRYK